LLIYGRKMNIEFEKTKTNILAWCNEDWTSLFWIVSFIGEDFPSKKLEITKKHTFEMIKNLLENQFVIAGDLKDDNTFHPWNKSLDETILGGIIRSCVLRVEKQECSS